MSEKNIVVYVSSLAKGIKSGFELHEEETGEAYRVLLLRNSTHRDGRTAKNFPNADIYVEANFARSDSIEKALLPYKDKIVAVTSRNESLISEFMKVIPNVPYVRTPTTESLKWASDKILMRRRFAAYDKTITPKYAVVRENTKDERHRVVKKIGFPLVVKPSNLAQSLLVQVCHHDEELNKALKTMFKKIKSIYKENHRTEAPKVIVEEFMDGLMYSVDASVSARGRVYFCPLVRVKTGYEVGHDDFFGYLQMTPTKLSTESTDRAHTVAKKAIHALGLRSTTAHVELMRVDNEWKVIEVGARIGGFRPELHLLSCGINHSMNDILIRMGKKPVIPKRCSKFAAAMKWFPKKEGVITKMTGVKKIQTLDSFVNIKINKQKGDRVKFAKNGGTSVFNLILANSDRSKLLADIRRVEEIVKIETE